MTTTDAAAASRQHTIPPLMRLNTRHTALLVALTLLLRAAVPLGYMPGNVFAGEFMVLCPAGSAPSFALLDAIREHTGPAHEHHGHHGHGAGTSDTGAHEHHDEHAGAVDDRCPIGSALSLAFLPAPELPPVSDWPTASYPKPDSALPAVVRFNRGHPVRGPPAALTLS